MTRIGLLGSKGSALDFPKNFEAVTGHSISHMAILPAGNRASKKVSYHMADRLIEAAGKRVLHHVNSYNLRHSADMGFFEGAELDILFVIGWERIIPGSILNTLRCEAYGMRGSVDAPGHRWTGPHLRWKKSLHDVTVSLHTGSG